MSGLEGVHWGLWDPGDLGPSGHLPRSAPECLTHGCSSSPQPWQEPKTPVLSSRVLLVGWAALLSAVALLSGVRRDHLDVSRTPLLLHNPQEAAAVLPKNPQ